MLIYSKSGSSEPTAPSADMPASLMCASTHCKTPTPGPTPICTSVLNYQTQKTWTCIYIQILPLSYQFSKLQRTAPDIRDLECGSGFQPETTLVLTAACTSTSDHKPQLLSQLPSVVSTTLRQDSPLRSPDTIRDVCETVPGGTSDAWDHVKESLQC